MDKQPGQQLYWQIKADIKGNRLPQGQALKQTELSERYGVSRIPVRDALQRLKNEGWLVACGKRGVMVASLCADEAEDLYLMRRHIEPLLLSFAMPHINHQVLGQAQDILAQMQLPQNQNAELQGELNWCFHRCLYQPAQRPTLLNTLASLQEQGTRYIGFHTLELSYADTSHNEHIALIHAIQERDLTKAQTVLEAHIVEAGELQVAHLRGEAHPTRD